MQTPCSLNWLYSLKKNNIKRFLNTAVSAASWRSGRILFGADWRSNVVTRPSSSRSILESGPHNPADNSHSERWKHFYLDLSWHSLHKCWGKPAISHNILTYWGPLPNRNGQSDLLSISRNSDYSIQYYQVEWAEGMNLDNNTAEWDELQGL